METIAEGFRQAIEMLLSGDSEVFGIVGLSLYVSGVSTIIAACLGVLLGIGLGVTHFHGKTIIIRIIYTLMSMPPVIMGLVVFLIIMRKGPLGTLGLSFTPTAMVIAQTCLVLPIVTGLTYNAVKEKSNGILEIARTLGANKGQTLILFLGEMKIGIMTAIITGFGRAISEVGAVMMVGGNIKGYTRVMTTYISQLKGMGEYGRAIAIGMILLAIAFIVNTILYHFQNKE